MPPRESPLSTEPSKSMGGQSVKKQLAPKTALIIGGLVLGLILVGGVFLWKAKTPRVVVPSSGQEKEVKLAKLVVWDDPAGFTFEYPKDVQVNKHDEDKENYAHVELTHAKYPGMIIVWAKDLPLTKQKMPIVDAGEWVENDPMLAGGSVLDTTLGGRPGKKILVSNEARTVISATVYDDVLWYIEGQFKDSDYWSRVDETIVSSFSFKPIGGGTGGMTGEEEIVVDEEEVVE